jgi:hypothetical protein
MTAEKLYGVFYVDADAPEDERYKWAQAPSALEAIAILERSVPGLPDPYELRLVEAAGQHLLEVVACIGPSPAPSTRSFVLGTPSSTSS